MHLPPQPPASTRSARPSHWLPRLIAVAAVAGIVACVGETTLPLAAPTLADLNGLPHVNSMRMIASDPDTGPTELVIRDGSEQTPDHPLPPGPLAILPSRDARAGQALSLGVALPLIANIGRTHVYPPQQGLASFYADHQRLATGGVYQPDGLTAAHKSLPFGTLVRCTRLDTRASVVVVINDRGPFVDGRIIDLSVGAARMLGMIDDGVVQCRLEILAYPLIESMGPRGNG